MSVLSKQFKDALAMIEPGEDAEHAAAAHAEVRDILADDDDLMEWGLHSVLFGSYRREVSIRRVKDVDVFCELPDLPDDQDPQDLLDKFASVLADEYGDRVSKNDRSVKVDFPDFDMHVDVVPARCADDAWEIPDRDGGWERTHPVKFSELSTPRNQDHDRQYVRTVKLLRQTRRALLHDAKPGGSSLRSPPIMRSPTSRTPAPPSHPVQSRSTTPSRWRLWPLCYASTRTESPPC